MGFSIEGLQDPDVCDMGSGVHMRAIAMYSPYIQGRGWLLEQAVSK